LIITVNVNALCKKPEEINVDMPTFLNELESIPAVQMPFNEMTAERLIGHILIHHHILFPKAIKMYSEIEAA
jgi:hypothetical protein